MDSLTAAEILALANLLAALARDMDIISVVIEKHLEKRRQTARRDTLVLDEHVQAGA